MNDAINALLGTLQAGDDSVRSEFVRLVLQLEQVDVAWLIMLCQSSEAAVRRAGVECSRGPLA